MISKIFVTFFWLAPITELGQVVLGVKPSKPGREPKRSLYHVKFSRFTAPPSKILSPFDFT